ncbi:IS110 family transposase [candidate division KSB1 bacterium]
MRKIQGYIVKNKDIFVGLEDSKKSWKLCLRSEVMIIAQVSMPAKYDNFINYLRKGFPQCRIKLIYEAGFSGFWLHDLLVSDGIECIVTPPHTVTVEKVSKVKTDKRDAIRLAKNLENGDYKSCYVPDRERREDRQINRTLTQVQKNIKREKNRIRGLLKFHGLERGLSERKWTNKDYLNLENLNLGDSLKDSLSSLLRMLKVFLEEEQKLKKALLDLIKKERYSRSVEIKKSCPGIGRLTAIRLTLEWGDMNRFRNGKSISSFTGLTSSEYSTGETTRKGRITSQGSRSVRGWLIQCSWASIKKDPALLTKFQNVYNNSGSRKKAIVAIARKLSVRIRAIELKDQPYEIGVIE